MGWARRSASRPRCGVSSASRPRAAYGTQKPRRQAARLPRCSLGSHGGASPASSTLPLKEGLGAGVAGHLAVIVAHHRAGAAGQCPALWLLAPVRRGSSGRVTAAPRGLMAGLGARAWPPRLPPCFAMLRSARVSLGELPRFHLGVTRMPSLSGALWARAE